MVIKISRLVHFYFCFPRKMWFFVFIPKEKCDFFFHIPQEKCGFLFLFPEKMWSKSLSLFINEDFKNLNLKGLRCSMKPYIDQGWMENIPLYAVEEYLKRNNDKKSPR